MKEYVCTYRYDGGKWGVSIVAQDRAEAVRRLRAIGTTGQVDGELVMRIPAYPGASIFVRAATLIRNLFRRQT